MVLTETIVNELVKLKDQHLQQGFVATLMKELSISYDAAVSIVHSAALADAYLNIEGKSYKLMGLKNKKELRLAILEYSWVCFLVGFSQVTNEESLKYKFRIYRERRGVDAYKAVKWFSYIRLNNRNSQKINDKELKFIECFLKKNPLAGYKKTYTALKAEFGVVSIGRGAIQYQLKKVLKTF